MRRARSDLESVGRLLQPGRSVATHTELKLVGMSPSSICRRIAPSGPWQRALPGIVFGHRGTPTPYERRLAAQAYGGPTSVITGADALAEHGVAASKRLTSGSVHVLIDHATQRTSHGFATMTRTRSLPLPVLRRDLRCAPLARAVVDACRRQVRLDDVRELVADVVQHHGVRAEDLATEVEHAARQRSAVARLVLAEIRAGLRSAAEARLREEFARRHVPQPLWNCEIVTDDGTVIAVPDALWPEKWVALELDSMQWHLSPAAYRRTQRRQRLLVVLGLDVLPVAPADVFEDADALCRDVTTTLARTAARDLPGLHVRPRSA